MAYPRRLAIALLSLLVPGPALAQQFCGPVILAGHDADDHGFEGVYAGLFDAILANVTNGGSGILSIGAQPCTSTPCPRVEQAGAWIETVG